VAGHFITLEGGEGSGKSTQMRHLEKKLAALSHAVVLTREPGGSPGAEAVRHVLLSGAAERFGSEMEALLFAAARADHVDQVVRPALQEGKVVISDRFFDSTRVYQGASGKADPELLDTLEKLACLDVWPELTIILDIDPESGLERVTRRLEGKGAPDRFEKDDIEQQEIRRAAYLAIAENEPDRCIVIDANRSEDDVAADIWQAVTTRLPELAEGPAGKKTLQARSSRSSEDVKSEAVKTATRSARDGTSRKTGSGSGTKKQAARGRSRKKDTGGKP
jgi:dTMP kinase